MKTKLDVFDLLKFAGVPARNRKDLRKYEEVFPDMSAFTNQSGYFWGPVGSGKTTQACNILYQTFISLCPYQDYYLEKLDWHSPEYDKNYAIQNIPVWFVKIPKLFREIKNTFRPSSDYTGPTEYEMLKKIVSVPFLVLDDLGIELTTDWAFNMLYTIIDERYSEELPTIFTSNLSLPQFAEKLEDKRLVSRIIGMCGKNILKFSDSDYRLPEKI